MFLIRYSRCVSPLRGAGATAVSAVAVSGAVVASAIVISNYVVYDKTDQAFDVWIKRTEGLLLHYSNNELEESGVLQQFNNKNRRGM